MSSRRSRAIFVALLSVALLAPACTRAENRLGTGDIGSVCEVWFDLRKFPEPDAADRGDLLAWADGIRVLTRRINRRLNTPSDKPFSAAIRRNLTTVEQSSKAFRRDLARAQDATALRLTVRRFGDGPFSAAADAVTIETDKVCRDS